MADFVEHFKGIQWNPDITIFISRYNDEHKMLWPGRSFSKMYGSEPRYNDIRYKVIPDQI